MTKREKQYTDWCSFWRKRKPVIPTFHKIGGYDCYSAIIPTGRIRVPDSMLKKMPKTSTECQFLFTTVYDEKGNDIDAWDSFKKNQDELLNELNDSLLKFPTI